MYKDKFNHSPFVFDVWVPFNGQRFKNTYLIRLKDGMEIEAQPNGGGWCAVNNAIYEDAEVDQVKLLRTPKSRNFHVGARRLQRDLEYFGKRYPVWCEDKFIWPEELEVGFRISPTEVFGYRPKGSDKVIIMASRGLVVEEGSNLPRLEDVIDYTIDPTFWWDDETVIMNNLDICNAIRYVHYHRKHIKENIQEAEALDAMLEELIPKRAHWITTREFVLKLVKEKGIETVRSMIQEANFMQRESTKSGRVQWGIPREDEMGLKYQRDEVINAGRGGNPADSLFHGVLLLRAIANPEGWEKFIPDIPVQKEH